MSRQEVQPAVEVVLGPAVVVTERHAFEVTCGLCGPIHTALTQDEATITARKHKNFWHPAWRKTGTTETDGNGD